MTITEFCLKNKTVTLALTVLIALSGVISYFRVGRLEDPNFTIKQAVITAQYPGASAAEVEQEVTNKLEIAIQQMKQLDKIWSISKPGYCTIYAEMKDQYDKNTLPQVWDELRRKMHDVRSELPAGVAEPVVNDDFGDVYGVFFALTGDGYTKKELYEHAKLLRRELLRCKNVAKIDLWGYTPEVVYCEVSRAKMSRLGIAPETIIAALNTQNTIGDGGSVEYAGQYIRIPTTGTFISIEQMEKLLIRGSDPEKLFRLKDVVTLRRGYYEPDPSILEFSPSPVEGDPASGKNLPAIGIGISTIPGTNVVTMGRAVQQRLEELKSVTPAGMQLHVISYESKTVEAAVNDFVINLVEALVIVMVLLLIFMGVHEGIIIGCILVLTVLATMIFMDWFGITMERISLGALIIAMGMLVDNAIVVAEGVVVKLQRKVPRDLAPVQAVEETKWPLLGATVIAILAFAAISMSQDAAGEFLGSLFKVLAISLILSWIFAITVAPLLCNMLITNRDAVEKDPHDNAFFRWYARVLRRCLHHRWKVIGVMVALLVVALGVFGRVSKNFFPASSRPQFLIDCWLREGAHINKTQEVLSSIEQELRKDPQVTEIATFAGRGALRFILTYSPEMPNPAYGQLLVGVKDYRYISKLMDKLNADFAERYPDTQFNMKKFELGPSTNAKIEARFLGPDPEVLHRLADEAKLVMQRVKDEKGTIKFIRDDWRQPVQTLSVDISEPRTRNAGLSRPVVNQAIALNFAGVAVGAYREKDELLPIIARAPQNQRASIDDLHNLMVWSSLYRKAVPMSQVVDDISLRWEDQNVRRRNRQLCLAAQCDPENSTTEDLFAYLKPQIEKITLPEGYRLEWGGEYETSSKARRMLFQNIPTAFALMLVVVLLLFGTLRHPVIIFIALPLAVIGVAWGLYLTGQPFGFMALLGFLSLSGMLIKNEIVLLDQIIQETRDGKHPFTAIIEASISRVRPVCMAAFTTVLGMIPLVNDPFFGPMAVTIMGGLTFATALTLVMMPVLYALFFQVHDPDPKSSSLPPRIKGQALDSVLDAALNQKPVEPSCDNSGEES